MFGISIFHGLEISLRDNLEYLHRASNAGINRVFMSLHIPEISLQCLSEFEEIFKVSQQLGLDVTVDISQSYIHKIDIKKYGVDRIRLDFGFSSSQIIKLSQQQQIQLNASTVTKDFLDNLILSGLNTENVEVCHNYYPRAETGISLDLLRNQNKLFKSHGFSICGFIASQYKKRGPFYAGLPTLESHRNALPLIAAQELMAEGVDDIFIGDSMASEEELTHLSLIKNNIFTLPIVCHSPKNSIESKILQQPHVNRLDPPEYSVRSNFIYGSTVPYQNKQATEILPFNTINRAKYSVCVDNYLYGRYQGCLQIVKKDFTADHRVNVVADASQSQVLVDRIKEGKAFEFLQIHSS